MVKLLVDLVPFEKGEIITVGNIYDTYLVEKGLAVWIKVQKQDFKKK